MSNTLEDGHGTSTTNPAHCTVAFHTVVGSYSLIRQICAYPVSQDKAQVRR